MIVQRKGSQLGHMMIELLPRWHAEQLFRDRCMIWHRLSQGYSWWIQSSVVYAYIASIEVRCPSDQSQRMFRIKDGDLEMPCHVQACHRETPPANVEWSQVLYRKTNPPPFRLSNIECLENLPDIGCCMGC